MKKDWKVKFYRNDEGECPMQEFIDTLKEKDKDKLFAFLKELKNVGIGLERPNSDYLRDGIHELRVKLSQGSSRPLYFFCFETNIIITHAFYKRTQEIPENEINRAVIYKEKILSKYNKDNIQELDNAKFS